MEEQSTEQTVDPKVHEAIKTIISKDPSELSIADKAFLRARKSYLGGNARKKFLEALAEENKEEVTPDETPDPLQHPANPESPTDPSEEDEVE